MLVQPKLGSLQQRLCVQSSRIVGASNKCKMRIYERVDEVHEHAYEEEDKDDNVRAAQYGHNKDADVRWWWDGVGLMAVG